MQRHGANVYDARGKAGAWLDFSSSVAELPLGPGLERKFREAFDSLTRYPQPYAVGLAQEAERRLGLPEGSVMVSHGASEALAWVAQSLHGRKVLVETPCFGEYENLLDRFGAKHREIGADEPWSPEWPRLKALVAKSQAFWTANPSNPAGLELTESEFEERLEFCRSKQVLLLLDESLIGQSLKPQGTLFLKRCVAKPGALVVRSLSKGLGLPGLRLGLLAGHPSEIAKLGVLQDPWSVDALSQALGPYLLSEELASSAKRALLLRRRKADLVSRLKGLPPHTLLPRESDTGFFLCRLLGKLDDSRRLFNLLRERACLVRSCASYGGWGTGYIRLNPREAKENALLGAALQEIYEAI